MAKRIVIISGAEALTQTRRFLNANEPKIAKAGRRLWRTQAVMISRDDAQRMTLTAQMPDAILSVWERMNEEYVQETVIPKYLDAFDTTEQDISRRLKKIIGKAGLPTRAIIQSWVNTHSGNLITRLNKDMHAVINALLQEHVVRTPMSPFQLAKVIRPHIGLTEQWSRAVSRTYQSFIDQGATVEQALAAAEKQAIRLHGVRAMNIARMELANAYGEGQWQSLVDAQNAGIVTDRIVKTWATADDERTCEECAGLDGEQQELNAEFSNGVMHNPAHVQCRCSNMQEIVREV
jgi:hypothetical protein